MIKKSHDHHHRHHHHYLQKSFIIILVTFVKNVSAFLDINNDSLIMYKKVILFMFNYVINS